MRTAMASLLVLVLVVTGCGGTGSGNPIGGRQCAIDDDCASLGGSFVEAAAPGPESPYQFVGARCDIVGFEGDRSEFGCFCDLGGGGSMSLRAGPGSECLRHSRDRTCMMSSAEFAGCDPGVADSCDAPCAELQTRLDVDEQRTLDVEVRSATCDSGSRHMCRFVVRIEDGCYVDASMKRHDCSLSDEAILAAEARPAGADGGPGTGGFIDAGSSH